MYLSSAEVAAVAAILGRIPTPEEYLKYQRDLTADASEIYRYLNFNELPEFTAAAENAERPALSG